MGPRRRHDKGMPAKVVLKVITNETTAANLLLTGGLNIATVSGPDRSRLQKAKLYKKVVVAGPGEIWFNENNGHPTASAAVRKGIVQALQLGQVGKVFTSGNGVPMKQLTLQTFTHVLRQLGQGQRAEAQSLGGPDRAVGSSSLKLLYANDGGPVPAPRWRSPSSSSMLQAPTQRSTVSTRPSCTLFGSGNWDVALVPLGVSAPTQPSRSSGPTPRTAATTSPGRQCQVEPGRLGTEDDRRKILWALAQCRGGDLQTCHLARRCRARCRTSPSMRSSVSAASVFRP